MEWCRCQGQEHFRRDWPLEGRGGAITWWKFWASCHACSLASYTMLYHAHPCTNFWNYMENAHELCLMVLAGYTSFLKIPHEFNSNAASVLRKNTRQCPKSSQVTAIWFFTRLTVTFRFDTSSMEYLFRFGGTPFGSVWIFTSLGGVPVSMKKDFTANSPVFQVFPCSFQSTNMAKPLRQLAFHLPGTVRTLPGRRFVVGHPVETRPRGRNDTFFRRSNGDGNGAGDCKCNM